MKQRMQPEATAVDQLAEPSSGTPGPFYANTIRQQYENIFQLIASGRSVFENMLLCIVVYCLSFAFCCCNKTIMETNMGRKGIYFTSWVTVHHGGKSAGIQIPEAGTKADAMTCSPWLAQPVFLHTPSCLPMGGTTHSWLDPSSVISVQENAAPPRLANRPVIGDVYSAEVPSSR